MRRRKDSEVTAVYLRAKRATRSAVISIFIIAAVPIRGVTAAHRIKPTSLAADPHGSLTLAKMRKCCSGNRDQLIT